MVTYFYILLNSVAFFKHAFWTYPKSSIWRGPAYLKLPDKVANLSLGDGPVVYQSGLDITHICGRVVGVLKTKTVTLFIDSQSMKRRDLTSGNKIWM